MSATDIIRVRLEPELKAAFIKYCEQKGVTVSQALRDFVQQETTSTSIVDRFDALLLKASKTNVSSGLRAPTIEGINAYIAKIRQDRLAAVEKGC
jgi:antitoxin component of RelBE/YafQ-DinJ toxin-antitoxin module